MSERRFELGWYNGWRPEERLATVPIQRDAIASGKLARPTHCSICGCGWSCENPVWIHDDNYADPLAAYSVCRRCHRALHQRFDDPAPWTALVQNHGANGKWFTQLSMDPLSRFRPYAAIYPDGLPSSSGIQEPLDGTSPS